jgi:hypothetical protein
MTWAFFTYKSAVLGLAALAYCLRFVCDVSVVVRQLESMRQTIACPTNVSIHLV